MSRRHALQLGPRMNQSTFSCYESLNLYQSDSTITFEPASYNPAIPRESLVILRQDCTVGLNAPPSATLGQEEQSLVFGILGIITLNRGDYVIVITAREKVGVLQGHEIYKAKEFQIIPVRSGVILSPRKVSRIKQQRQEEDRYLEMIGLMLHQDYHFSYTRDITRSTQSKLKINTENPLWEQADDRFFWNKHVCSKFINATIRNKNENLSRFILPVICGFVAVKDCHNKVPFTYAVISRRSRFRAGTRYHCRGTNDEAQVSNFVETEQIVISLTGMVSIASGHNQNIWRLILGVFLYTASRFYTRLLGTTGDDQIQAHLIY